MKNLIRRSLTGIIYVAVVLCGLSYPYAFPGVFGLIVGLALWEFYGLVRHYGDASLKRLPGTVGGVYLFFACYAYANGWMNGTLFLPYFLFLMFVFISEMYAHSRNPIHNWAFVLLGQVVCAAFSLLNFIIFRPAAGEAAGVFTPLPALALFVFVWLNDTCAYLVGSKFGRRRLFERISPAKSWEGFWGGLVAVLASSQIFAFYYQEISWYHWLGISATIVVFATWGDLSESLFKRTLGIKDSGTLLPGHGGMLDRFDSILMAIPALYIYLRLFIQN
ncbi:MAG: phosphatidate cytidylyltransferase [Tannerellaceae bacterium]|nr:phosphatidate cytidylyltransferase [Tannerellaceae bacterium]